MFALREIVLFVCTYVIELSEKLYVNLSAKFPDFTQAETEVSRRNKGGSFICIYSNNSRPSINRFPLLEIFKIIASLE